MKSIASIFSSAGILLILLGFAFKASVAPMHFWVPDAYEGAPTPVAAFFSVGPKAAGFALMIRFFYSAFLAAPGGAGAASPSLRACSTSWARRIWQWAQ